jgi:hypothetical protein
VLPPLRKILLDGGCAEAKLSARRTDDGDIDRRRIKVDPLVDPAQSAIRVLQLPSLIIVLREKANRDIEQERDAEHCQDRENKPAYGRFSLRNACGGVEDDRVRVRLRSRRCRVRLRGHASAISFPIEAL